MFDLLVGARKGARGNATRFGHRASRASKHQVSASVFATLLERKHLFWIFKFAQVLAKLVRFLRPGDPQVVISETHFRHNLQTKQPFLINDQLASYSTKRLSFGVCVAFLEFLDIHIANALTTYCKRVNDTLLTR